MTMNSEKNPFQVKISDNSFIEIVWAKAHKNSGNQACVAEFSADFYVDGVAICTMNKLSILNTTSRETGESVLHIGSMYSYERKGDKEQRIFSITFFPGSRKDKDIEQDRANFVNECVEAVTAFIQHQAKQFEEKKMRKPASNPQLDKLKEVGNNVRSFFVR